MVSISELFVYPETAEERLAFRVLATSIDIPIRDCGEEQTARASEAAQPSVGRR